MIFSMLINNFHLHFNPLKTIFKTTPDVTSTISPNGGREFVDIMKIKIRKDAYRTSAMIDCQYNLPAFTLYITSHDLSLCKQACPDTHWFFIMTCNIDRDRDWDIDRDNDRDRDRDRTTLEVVVSAMPNILFECLMFIRKANCQYHTRFVSTMKYHKPS